MQFYLYLKGDGDDELIIIIEEIVRGEWIPLVRYQSNDISEKMQ